MTQANRVYSRSFAAPFCPSFDAESPLSASLSIPEPMPVTIDACMTREKCLPEKRHLEISNEAALTHSEDGVDLTLIRWMLSMTPAERLETLQQNIRSTLRLLGEETNT